MSYPSPSTYRDFERRQELEKQLDDTRGKLAHLIGYHSAVGGGVLLSALLEVYRLAGGTADLLDEDEQ